MAAARRVVDAAGAAFGFRVEWSEFLAGGIAIDTYGVAIRDEDVAACGAADAILLGAVGGPKWSDPSAPVRPEQALFALRGGLGLYANLRPVTVHPALVSASPLRPELLAGVDMLIVRELTGGLYFGERQEPSGPAGQRTALDTLPYSEFEVGRIVRLAFELARTRRRRVTSVDKANVLATSRLWRTVADEVASGLPRRRAEPPAGRLVRDAPRPPAGRLRRHRHREPLRRHPVRRGVRPGGQPGHAAVGLARRAADRARDVRPVRADPRVRPRHRGAGQGQPGGDDPLRGDAAADVARPR